VSTVTAVRPEVPAGQVDAIATPLLDVAPGIGGAVPVLADPVPPTLPLPVVRVLGPVRLDGFVDLPAQGPLVDLLIFLALHPERAFLNDTLRGRLATGYDTEVSEDTMRSYASRLRRHLPAGVQLVSSRAGYQLVGVTTDLAVFNHHTKATATSDVATNGSRDAGSTVSTDVDAIASVSAGLAMIEGVPFETDRTPRWVDDETFRVNTQTDIVTAARYLDRLAGLHGWDDRVLWGYHQAAIAAPTDQALAADTLTAAARHHRPGTLHQEWQRILARLAAEDQTPSRDLAAHYRTLQDQQP
jgi:hypothetical protein